MRATLPETGSGLRQEPDAMQATNPLHKPDAFELSGEAALYIATLTDELAQLAKRHGLNSLGYLLDMARLEADQISKSVTPASRCA
jgi:hypothetical protein